MGVKIRPRVFIRILVSSDCNTLLPNLFFDLELNGLFDYQYYVRHVDEIFQRVGLT